MPQERFGIAHGFPDAGELLASGLVDAVVIATPHDTHHDLAVAALAAALDVYVEKPLALTAADARDIEARVAESGRQLMLGYTHQCSTIAQRLRARIGEGGLGDLVHVAGLSANCMRPLLEGQSGEAVFGQAPAERTETYASRARGGGQAHGQATHGLGLILSTTSLRPVTVSATMNDLDLGVDIADAIAIDVRGWRDDLDVVGRHASPRAAPSSRSSATTVRADTCSRTRSRAPPPSTGSPARSTGTTPRSRPVSDSLPMREFVRLLTEGGANHAPVGPAARVVEVLEAAHRSHREGAS